MNRMTSPAPKRAWHYKQERVKNAQLTRFRNQITKFLSFVLPIIALTLLTADLLGRSNVFPIHKIEYRGLFEQVSQVEVDKAAKAGLNGNFFTIDLFSMQKEIASLAWVKSVRLDRQWPDTIVVFINEFQPFMRWGNGGWVTRSGELVTSLAYKSSLTVQELPTLNGKRSELMTMLYKFRQWQRDLDAMGLSIMEVTFSESRSWTMVLRSVNEEAFTLQLGSVNEDERFRRFIRLYAKDESFFGEVEYVDARYPNGVVLKKKPDVFEGQINESDAEV